MSSNYSGIAANVVDIVEGFGNYVAGHHNDEVYTVETKTENSVIMNNLIMMLIVKLLLIYLVSAFLWPNVMPKLFSNATDSPSFLNVLGFSIIIGILF